MTAAIELTRDSRYPESDPATLREREVIGALLLCPAKIPKVAELVSPEDFADPRLARIFRTQLALAGSSAGVGLMDVAAELAAIGDLERIGGLVFLTELLEATPTAAYVEQHARQVQRNGTSREIARHAHRLVEDPTDQAALDRLTRARAALDQSDGNSSSANALVLTEVGVTGDRLRARRDEAEPESPLPGFLDPEPSLTALIGKNESGKTTFAVNLALAWATQEPPWDGAASLPGGRVLIVSNEQTTRRIDWLARRMADQHNVGSEHAYGRYAGWEDRVVLIGKDSRAARRLRMLDQQGIELLRSSLEHADKVEGDPFKFVVLDSLSRLKPADVPEKDNDLLSEWLDGLAQIAIDLGIHILLVHHTGHEARSEARSAARGASAIGAVSAAQWLLEVAGDRHRRVKVDGNALLTASSTFRVALEGDEPGSIRFFELEDQTFGRTSGSVPEVSDYMQEDEEVSQTELAWRISGKAREPGKRPGGAAQEKATAAVADAARAGIVTTREGPHGSTLIRRIR